MSNGVEKTEGDDEVISFPYRGEQAWKNMPKERWSDWLSLALG